MSPGGTTDLSVTTVVVAVLAVVGWFGALWWQKRRATGPDELIRLLALRPMGGKRLLALIEVERERFLLGFTDESISCLARIEPSLHGSATRFAAAPSAAAPAPTAQQIAAGEAARRIAVGDFA